MPLLSDTAAISAVRELLSVRSSDLKRLDPIHEYMRGRQDNPATPPGAPTELRRLAKISRVNMMKIVCSSITQQLYVDGFRQRLDSEDAPVWSTWQANRLDRGQIAIHRAAVAYGLSYASVMPSDDGFPAIRGYSPRRMTAIYDQDNDDWPLLALKADPSGEGWMYTLYDDAGVYFVEGDGEVSATEAKLTFVNAEEHGLDVTPIIRFLNEQDLDQDNDGEIEPLMVLQDQVDLTTFGLLVAQHYAAFRQRYIIGWTAETETTLLKASAARMLTFDDKPDDVQVGEFAETTLDGYIKSREDTLKQIAALSQTPAHELIGSLVNLSAEALVAAEASQRRKVMERQTSFGESWEMVLDLASQLDGSAADSKPDSQVRWRDTESRALAATVDALGKMATMLGIPPQELWERLPNTSQQDIERWKAAAKEMDPIESMTKMLDRQGKTQDEDANAA